MTDQTRKGKGKKKFSVSTLLLILMFTLGIGLLLYPPLAQAWNRKNATRMVASYETSVEEMDNSALAQLRSAAIRYNRTLPDRTDIFSDEYEQSEEYQNLLKTDPSGQMGVIEIPSIDVKLPVYHGVNQDVLAAGIGHMPSTSIPIGGKGTHAVLTGHSGLPSAELFTHLDQVQIGETFELHVLGETLTYQVDQINIVKPWETELLAIDPDQDYVTLVTCTPYGINTERLLVRGKRVTDDVLPYAGLIPNEAIRIPPWICALILTVLAAILVFGLMFYRQNQKARRRKILKDSGFEELSRKSR